MPYKVGDVVKIYEDPLTEKKLEGEAKLIQQLSEDVEREFWLVEMTRGHERHPRWITKKGEHHYPPGHSSHRVEINSFVTEVTFDLGARSIGVYGRDRVVLWSVSETSYAPPLPDKVSINQYVTEIKFDFDKNMLDVYGTNHVLLWGIQTSVAEPESFCKRLQYFIDEEEKGIGEYESFVQAFYKELAAQPGALEMVNRIIEEQRSHVERLKRIKEEMCPSEFPKVTAESERASEHFARRYPGMFRE